jgi:hypothetical protein
MLAARAQRRAGVGSHVGHLVVGMKRREVERHVGPSSFMIQRALGLDLLVESFLPG